MSVKEKFILTIDDDPIMNRVFALRFAELGCNVTTTTSKAEFLQKLKEKKFRLLVVDLNIEEDGDGFQLIRDIRLIHKIQTPIIVCSSLDDEKTVAQALEEGANDYIVKPPLPQTLIKSVKDYVDIPDAEEDNYTNLSTIPEEDSPAEVSFDIKVIEVSDSSISILSTHLIRKHTLLKLHGAWLQQISPALTELSCTVTNNSLIHGENPMYRIDLEFENIGDDIQRALKEWMVYANKNTVAGSA